MKTVKYLTRFFIIPVLLLASFAIAGLSSASPRAYAACPPIAGYPTFGFDTGRSSYNPFECVISPAVVPPANWVSPLALPTAPREGISTDNIKGYVGQGNSLVSFTLATGAPVWGFATPGAVVGSATIFLGNIYFGSQSGNLYALNPAGGLICTVALGGAISTTPIGSGNILIVSRDNGVVFGINPANCAVLWATPVLGTAISSPSLSGNTAVVSAQITPAQSDVVGINALTGAITGVSPAFPGTLTAPAVAGGQVFIGSSNPAVAVINLALPAFAVTWVSPVAGEPVLGKPAVDFPNAPNQVYVVSATTGRLFALNAITGAINWAAAAACGPLYQAASPTVANGGVYVGGKACMNAFKVGGGGTWGLAVGVLADSPATVVNGLLLFTANVGAVEKIFSF
jgi:outer membrane protein assembly factor BamB